MDPNTAENMPNDILDSIPDNITQQFQPEQSNIFRLKSIDSFKIINPNIENEETSNDTGVNSIPEDTLGLDIGPDDFTEKININANPEKLYMFLLDEIYGTIDSNGELFGNRSNINISKPEVKYENRKTFWYNFGKNCSQVKRTTAQLKKYYEKELGVETSINEKSSLILRGKYDTNLIASLYKKYIKNYVICTSCRSIQTEIIRKSSNRLDYLKCLNPKCNTCKVVVKIT
jgi:translation initiation factor 2 beta subunit (eIF-2beta)/eIF-5